MNWKDYDKMTNEQLDEQLKLHFPNIEPVKATKDNRRFIIDVLTLCDAFLFVTED